VTTRAARVPCILAVTIAAAMTAAQPVAAQVRVSSIDEVRQALSPGDTVSVVQTTGGVVKGRILGLGITDLEIRPEAEDRSGGPRRDVRIPLDAIQSIERRRDPPRNGALIGAGVGAGITGAMLIAAVAVDRNEIDEWAPIYLGYGVAFSGLGALIGWAVDAGRSKPAVRYDRPASESSRVTVAVSPRGRRGVAVIVSF
jgi:hypothetical protein